MADVLTPSSADALSDAEELEDLSEKPKSFGRLAFERFVPHRLAPIRVIRGSR